jgi:3-oxoacyl-[acyl-carrier-protein] synthase-3
MRGTGRFSPERVLTNADLETMVETSDQWIRERSGIRERRIASDEETGAFMAKEACEAVLRTTGVSVDAVDAIVLATATVNVAEGLIASEQAENVLVVGVERLSRVTDYTDRTTCILFGDGAGATLVQPAANGDTGILATYMKSDGRLAELLYRPSGGAIEPPSETMLEQRGYYIRMAGREVFKSAVLSMADACDQALQRAGLTGDDVDLLIPHQANVRIIEATAKHANIPMDKVYVNVDRFGNTSAASIPIALDECVNSGRVKEGDLVLLVAFGGGFTWASAAVRW